MRRSSTETREHVLRVARELFYWDGIRSTGVDKIAREAKVAVTTLYRLFPTKDDLVGAYVEREAQQYREWFSAAVADTASGPRARILALFDALAEQVQPSRCRGCPFQMAMAELADQAQHGHKAAVAVKIWTREQLRTLTSELVSNSPAVDGDALADQLMLVFEGVYASVQSLGDTGPAAGATALAARLIDLR